MSGLPIKVGKAFAEHAGLAHPKRLKAKRSSPTKAKVAEATIQAQVDAYLPWVGLEHFRIEDVVLRTVFGGQGLQGGILRELQDAAEIIRGWPDTCVFDPRFPGHFLPLELKTEIGKMSKAQKRWQKILGTRVPRSFEEARAEIDAWRANLERGGCGN